MIKTQQKWIPGDFFVVPLQNKEYGYGRVLESPLIAIYSVKDKNPSIEVDKLKIAEVLFRVWVMKYAITEGVWPVIGHDPLSEQLKITPPFFKQDAINNNLTLYFGNGKESPATYDQCVNLEYAAVWEPNHIQDRIEDHFAGLPNKWVESLRPRP